MEELKFIVSVSVLAGLLTGCQIIGKMKKYSDAAPRWVMTTPQKEGELCAVGSTEPAFYKEDAKGYAADNARKELARSLKLEIRNIIVDISTDRGSNVDEGTFMEVSSWATSTVLKESVIVNYWHDEEGIASHGRKGIAYALACMPLNAIAVQEISNKLNLDN